MLQKLTSDGSIHLVRTKIQKQPSIGVLIKRYSENMQQVYRTTPMLKCDLLFSIYKFSTFSLIFLYDERERAIQSFSRQKVFCKISHNFQKNRSDGANFL